MLEKFTVALNIIRYLFLCPRARVLVLPKRVLLFKRNSVTNILTLASLTGIFVLPMVDSAKSAICIFLESVGGIE